MSTPNVYIFLEYGILPLGHEIEKRRMTYLHHVLTVRENDPVRLVYDQGLKLPYEANWANDITVLRSTYGITQTDAEVARLTYQQWKGIVQEKVERKVFEELREKANGASKTKDLLYETFAPCSYLYSMDPFSARKIARFRSRMVLCKANQKSAHMSMSCRAGCEAIETQEHLVNCVEIHGKGQENIETTAIKNMQVEILQLLVKKLTVVEEWMEQKDVDS